MMLIDPKTHLCPKFKKMLLRLKGLCFLGFFLFFLCLVSSNICSYISKYYCLLNEASLYPEAMTESPSSYLATFEN